VKVHLKPKINDCQVAWLIWKISGRWNISIEMTQYASWGVGLAAYLQGKKIKTYLVKIKKIDFETRKIII